MAHHPHHSPGFLALVNDAKTRVRQLTIDEYRARVDRGEASILVDTREDNEWERGHLPGAIHLSKGIIERDIEKAVPDKDAPIVLYCGGGFRSALVGDNLQKMGYTNVISLDGGFRGWAERGLPVDEG
jgi:rhodanese-related sulfurtransferase